MNDPDPPVIEGEIVTVDSPTVGTVAVRPDTSLRDALAKGWIENYDRRSPNTAARYARDVPGWTFKDGRIIPTDNPTPGAFFAWVDANGYDAFKMLPWHIEQWMRYLATAEHHGRYTSTRKLSDATISSKVAAVSSFFKYCARQSRDVPIPNPTLGTDRPPARAEESPTLSLSRAQLDDLIAVARQRGTREHAMVMVMALTGIRVSELCALDTGDLVADAGEWMLEIIRKGRKRGRVPCPEPARRAIRRYIRGRRGPMFLRDDGQRLTRQSAAKTLYSLAREIFPDTNEGRAQARRITPHSLRHTATTLALKQPGVTILDVRALMGHASVSTTQRYEHSNRVRNNPAARALGEMFEDGLPDVEDI